MGAAASVGKTKLQQLKELRGKPLDVSDIVTLAEAKAAIAMHREMLAEFENALPQRNAVAIIDQGGGGFTLSVFEAGIEVCVIKGKKHTNLADAKLIAKIKTLTGLDVRSPSLSVARSCAFACAKASAFAVSCTFPCAPTCAFTSALTRARAIADA